MATSNSFRLVPHACLGGETMAVRCEGLARPAQLVGQTCTVELRLGQGSAQLAEFTATIQRGAQGFSLGSVRRSGAAPKLPEAQPRPIPAIGGAASPGSYTRNPRWLPRHLYLKFDDGSRHLVIIPEKIGPGIASNPYLYQVELGVSVDSRQIFSSSGFPSSVDCANLLAHDCAEWAQCMVADHRERLSKLGIGTHYGSKAVLNEPPEKLRKKGLDSASCVGYLLGATGRGHRELGLPQLWQEAKESYLTGSTQRTRQGTIIPGSGVGLVKGLVECARWTAVLWITPHRIRYTPLHNDLMQKLKTARQDRGKFYGMQMAEILDGRGSGWNAQRAALSNVPYGLACINAGFHTALIADGKMYGVDQRWDEKHPQVFYQQPGLKAWPLYMLLCFPPGLWERARARGGS